MSTMTSDMLCSGLLAFVQKSDFSVTAHDFSALSPLIAMAVGSVLVLLVDLLLKKSQPQRELITLLSYASLAVAFFLGLGLWSGEARHFVENTEVSNSLSLALIDTWRASDYSVLATLLAIGISTLVLALSRPWFQDQDFVHFGEYHFLLILFPLGISLMTGASNLILAIIGLELFSLALYVLVGIRRGQHKGSEATLKYFLLGAFAAAVFLYGAALIYAGNESGLLIRVRNLGQSATLPAPTGLAAIGGGLVFMALFFKGSVVPFHIWTPDVYESAPTPITALMSTGTKIGAFLLMLSVLHFVPHQLHILFPILCALTIVIGNAGALAQTKLKRMLAYSGIGHAGYLMLSITVAATVKSHSAAELGVKSTIFYLITYAASNLVAFGVLSYLERQEEKVLTLDGIKGLARRNPMASAALALSMFSLAGLPPTAGFWGKYYIFDAAIRSQLWLLAIIGILASVIGLYYYLRVVAQLYFHDAEEASRIPARGYTAPIAIAASSAVILLIGLAPNLLFDFLIAS
ncbi:MAG: hypothetical protein CSA62_09000 [Planctomycetota bacterium]|nr:MAG: hypothetical protein CSA62_09000 [Planctomycetota bacterium]